jgi:predicted AlkP superfamily phosphohydrolase/phosphomutase
MTLRQGNLLKSPLRPHRADRRHYRNAVGCHHGRVKPGYQEGLRLYDVGPTVLNLFGVPPDPQAIGRSLTAYQLGLGARVKQWWRG